MGERWSDERRQDYEDTMRDKALEAREADYFDDEQPEEPRIAEIYAKAAAWDALVEMRGELSWHTDMERWWVNVPIRLDDHGLVEHIYTCVADPIEAVTDMHARWRECGRPTVGPRSDDEDACAKRHLEDVTLTSAEEIKARRAKEADRG